MSCIFHGLLCFESTTHSTRTPDCHKVFRSVLKLNELTSTDNVHLVKSISLCAFVESVAVITSVSSVSISQSNHSQLVSFLVLPNCTSLSLSCHSPGPPCVLPAGNLGAGGPQRAPGGPHGSGCEADGDMSPDVQTDGDWAEPGDRPLQPAGQ